MKLIGPVSLGDLREKRLKSPASSAELLVVVVWYTSDVRILHFVRYHDFVNILKNYGDLLLNLEYRKYRNI